MDQSKRTQIWEAYFDSEWLSRYFQSIADRRKAVVIRASTAVAILSCGPLANFMAWVPYGPSVAAITGLAAGVLGVWLASSGVINDMATARRCAAAWNRRCTEMRFIWTRTEAGEDTWEEYLSGDRAMLAVDEAILESNLRTDNALRIDAVSETQSALGLAA